jgi:hypothetical protein
MFVMRTTKDPANSIGKLVSAQQSLGLCDLAFAVGPLRFYCVEPRALGRQQAANYPHPTATFSNLAIVGGDPGTHLMAFMPACVVPDKKQRLLAPLLEPVAAPPKKLRGYGAHGPAIDEPEPRLLKLRQIKPVAGEGLRLGIVLSRFLLNEAHRLSGIRPGMQRRSLEARKPGLVTETQNPLGVGLGEADQSISSPFFLAYSGSGLSIQRLGPAPNALRASPVLPGWSRH